MRDWKYVPKRQRRACVTLIVCILFFLASASATVLLLILDARSANPVLPQVMAELTGKAEPEVQQPEFPGGALPESADAGQAYLDETIFVGDSNTVRMFAYGLVPLENYMALEGMGIESISQGPCVYFSGAQTTPAASLPGSRLSMLTATRLRRFRMLTRIATSSSTQFRP